MNDETKEEKKKTKTKLKKKHIDKIDTVTIDKEIEQFIENLKIHTKPAYTVRKIKPYLSDDWINNITK
jgi:hypothetical protein